MGASFNNKLFLGKVITIVLWGKGNCKRSPVELGGGTGSGRGNIPTIIKGGYYIIF